MSDPHYHYPPGFGRLLNLPALPKPMGIEQFIEPPKQVDWAAIAARLYPPKPPAPLSAPMITPGGYYPSAVAPSLIGGAGLGLEALDKYRRRADWNARFEHWERPASDSEEGAIDRAKRLVPDAISDSVWLGVHNATVQPQGSAHNNTNTRRDADIDLRVELPLFKVDYHPNVKVDCAEAVLQLSDSGWTYEQLFAMMRWELETCLGEAFGKKNVVPGKKAFRVKGITGSRAEADVVPALGYRQVMWWDREKRYNVIQGVAILSTTDEWTLNFPAQHSANGIAKRQRTGQQFKKVVRIFKRLRADLVTRGLLVGKVPSFLVECLVYLVEDGYFTVASDDRFNRTYRVALRLQTILRDRSVEMREINAIKPLFTPDQAWTYADACVFVDAVVAHLRYN